MFTVIESFATTGITTGGNLVNTVVNCTIYAAATNCILVNPLPTTGILIVANSILGGCTNGINNSTGGNTNGVILFRNHFYSCTNNIVAITDLDGASGMTVSTALGAACLLFDSDTDPFTDKASNNFSLLQGAVDRQAGYPGAFEVSAASATMTGYPDIGAVSHVEDYPAVGNVDTDDTTDGLTGTLEQPAESDVKDTVQYGAGGTEFTGNYAPAGGGGGDSNRGINRGMSGMIG